MVDEWVCFRKNLLSESQFERYRKGLAAKLRRGRVDFRKNRFPHRVVDENACECGRGVCIVT